MEVEWGTLSPDYTLTCNTYSLKKLRESGKAILDLDSVEEEYKVPLAVDVHSNSLFTTLWILF